MNLFRFLFPTNKLHRFLFVFIVISSTRKQKNFFYLSSCKNNYHLFFSLLLLLLYYGLSTTATTTTLVLVGFSFININTWANINIYKLKYIVLSVYIYFSFLELIQKKILKIYNFLFFFLSSFFIIMRKKNYKFISLIN